MEARLPSANLIFLIIMPLTLLLSDHIAWYVGRVIMMDAATGLFDDLTWDEEFINIFKLT